MLAGGSGGAWICSDHHHCLSVPVFNNGLYIHGWVTVLGAGYVQASSAVIWCALFPIHGSVSSEIHYVCIFTGVDV